jgi:hypothetical protein
MRHDKTTDWMKQGFSCLHRTAKYWSQEHHTQYRTAAVSGSCPLCQNRWRRCRLPLVTWIKKDGEQIKCNIFYVFHYVLILRFLKYQPTDALKFSQEYNMLFEYIVVNLWQFECICWLMLKNNRNIFECVTVAADDTALIHWLSQTY